MNPRLRQVLELASEHAFVTICLVIFLAAGGTGYYLNRKVAVLEAEHEIVRAEGENDQRMIAGAAALRADREAVAAAVKEIRANLIVEENLADNLGYFYKLEDQSHARISDLHQMPSPVGATNSTVKTVPFTVNVTGTFAQVYSFLYQLEHGPRLMRITAFTFDRKLQSGDSVVLELTIEMLARP